MKKKCRMGEIIEEEQREEMEMQMALDAEMSDFIEEDVDYPDDSW